MPEGLQQGDTGQLLQERIDGLDSLISELDGVDFTEPDEDENKDDADGDDSPVINKIGELKTEIEGFNWSF